MSIFDLSIQNDYCSKLSKTHSSTYYQTISRISAKHPSDQTPEEKHNLINLLRQIHSITQTFKNITDDQSLLQQCSDSLELCSFKRGEHLILQGDKCDEVFIILEGTVNIYDLKNAQEVEKQKREAFEAKNHTTLTQSKFSAQAPPSRSYAFNKDSSLSNSGVGSKRRGNNAKTLRENQSLEGSKDEETVSKASSITIPEEQPAFNIQRIIKIKTVMAFLRSKNREVAAHKRVEDHTYEHLPEAEQLFLDNQTCRKKYFKDGACLLSLKDTVGYGYVLNEKCLLLDYRSPVAMVAEEDVVCLRLERETFREIMRSELKNMEEKRTFFLDFFPDLREISVLQIVDHIVEKTYKMHEKIYNQGDDSQGVYFVKGGGEVKLYLSLAQKTKESEDVKLDSSQADLFLPNQHRTQRKLTSTVGIVSQGDFFGEESLAGEHSVRKYTALSGSEQLVLYYLAPEHFHRVSHLCPEMFKILNQRAENRNEWMEEKIKTSEAVKERSKELFHISKQSAPRRFSANASSHPLILKKNNTERQSESRMQNKFVMKDENFQQMSTNGSLPNYFVLKSSRDSVESKQDNSFKSLKAWPTGDISVTSDRDRAKSGSVTRDDALSMRSVEIPSSFKIFDQKRRAKKHPEMKKTHDDGNKKEDLTMTGLKKETRTMHAFHSLVVKQAASPSSSNRPMTHYTPDSLVSPRKSGPQFEVKSYTPSSGKALLPSIEWSQNYLGQEDRASPGSVSARRNLSSSHEFSRFEMASRNSIFKPEGSSPNKVGANDSQGKSPRGSFTQRNVQAISPRGSFTQRGESRQDKIILELNQEFDFVRKGSKAHSAVQKQVCQLTEPRAETEPSMPIKLNVVGSRQVGSIFKPKAKTVLSTGVRKQKIGI